MVVGHTVGTTETFWERLSLHDPHTHGHTSPRTVVRIIRTVEEKGIVESLRRQVRDRRERLKTHWVGLLGSHRTRPLPSSKTVSEDECGWRTGP